MFFVILNVISILQMITLTDSLYIGEGEIRRCFVHPEHENLCIKVPRPHIIREYTYKEILYFLKLAKRRLGKKRPPFFSDFKEEIDTNLGLGQVFDLVRDETTGEISKTLEYYLYNPSNNVSDEKLWIALSVLKQHMIEYKVFTRDLRSRNLCCKINNNNTIEIIIIDGIGHRDFFPFADYFKYFSKKKVERTFKKWHFSSLEDQRQFLAKSKG